VQHGAARSAGAEPVEKTFGENGVSFAKRLDWLLHLETIYQLNLLTSILGDF
jgi:hypothetical protein